MDEEKGYNGWRNIETYIVNNWITSDVWVYHQVSEIAEESEIRTDSVMTLSGAIAEMVKRGIPIEEGGMYKDLLNAALSKVDWCEIAGSLRVLTFSENQKKGLYGLNINVNNSEKK